MWHTRRNSQYKSVAHRRRIFLALWGKNPPIGYTRGDSLPIALGQHLSRRETNIQSWNTTDAAHSFLLYAHSTFALRIKARKNWLVLESKNKIKIYLRCNFASQIGKTFFLQKGWRNLCSDIQRFVFVSARPVYPISFSSGLLHAHHHTAPSCDHFGEDMEKIVCRCLEEGDEMTKKGRE